MKHTADTEEQKVFGIGLSRTGSKTLNDSLKALGYRSHFVVARDDLDALLPQFDAFTHFPLVEKYGELDRRFPQSKFILTIRERESWLQSCEYRLSLLLAANASEVTRELLRRVYGTETFDRQKYSDTYDRYHDEVKQYFHGREDSLLILNICEGEGFEKLCPFLGKQIPEQSFPYYRQNSRLELQKNRRRIKRFVYRLFKAKQVKRFLQYLFWR